MASRIEHRAEYTSGVAAVYAAQSDEDALRARLEHLGGTSEGLREHQRTADGVRYVLLQGIAAEKLPQAVRTLHKGDLVVHREHTFTADGDGYQGTIAAHVDGVPGRITARTEITTSSAGTVQRTTGEVKIQMPLVGGKLEGVVAEQVTRLLQMEAEFTSSWLAD